MRVWQALVLGFPAALCWCVAAAAVTTATEATCGPGQVSTTAKPCTPSAAVVPAPVAAAPDPEPSGARTGVPDAVTIFIVLDRAQHKYQIEIENTSGIGYINTFNWLPPHDMTITAITSTEGGHCALINNAISCTAGKKGIAPPICTCLAGGSMLVNFIAVGMEPTYNGEYWTSFWNSGSYTQITSMTPVPYHIPSFISSAAADLPLCAKGQTSTKAKLCSTH
jgi:hypothetical protein